MRNEGQVLGYKYKYHTGPVTCLYIFMYYTYLNQTVNSHRLRIKCYIVIYLNGTGTYKNGWIYYPLIQILL